LGKRKRIARADVCRKAPSPPPSTASESDGEDIQAIFRRAFEAKFAPLPEEHKKPKLSTEEKRDKEELEQEDEGEESDWSGISSEEEEEEEEEGVNNVEVIEYSGVSHTSAPASRAELRAFMSSKPPKTTSAAAPLVGAKSTSKSKSTDDPESSTDNLKNDLDLQRLLRDSHLLHTSAVSSNASSTPNPLTLTGSLRHKSTDLHLLSLGAKKSIHHQKNMPMPERRANAAKAKALEEKRRIEARENGIVLEKEARKPRLVGKAKARERGVGGPAVGKFRSGTLTLSKRDVASITSSGGRGGRGGRG
ncbi:hypothetical protein K504DRAFT_354017, partial [Pleomassaria siparia CBS 279.74]